MGSLSHIAEQKKKIVKEVHNLLNEGCSLELSDSQPIIAQFRVRLNLLDQIKVAQNTDPEIEVLKKKIQEGKDRRFTVCQGIIKLNGRLCVLDVTDIKQQILHEAHFAPYNVHPGATKMYHDIKTTYWWNGLKRDVAEFVASCLTCQQVKVEHQRPTGLLQELPMPE